MRGRFFGPEIGGRGLVPPLPHGNPPLYSAESEGETSPPDSVGENNIIFSGCRVRTSVGPVK